MNRIDADIREYISDHTQSPEVWAAGEGKRSRVDSTFRVASILMQHCHMSEVDAWNTTYSRGVCYALVVAESNGSVDLIDEDEMEKARQATELLREAVENG
jgi:hypothetical protein